MVHHQCPNAQIHYRRRTSLCLRWCLWWYSDMYSPKLFKHNFSTQLFFLVSKCNRFMLELCIVSLLSMLLYQVALIKTIRHMFFNYTTHISTAKIKTTAAELNQSVFQSYLVLVTIKTNVHPQWKICVVHLWKICIVHWLNTVNLLFGLLSFGLETSGILGYSILLLCDVLNNVIQCRLYKLSICSL